MVKSGSPPHPAARPLAALIPAALVAAMVSVFWAAPARANHDDDDDEIYCQVHRGHFEPRHYQHHPAGYVLFSSGGYHFYPQPASDVLVDQWYGRPALFVSGGFFHPLTIGYDLGRTHLGLGIGFHAFPTLGYGFLARPVPIVHYAPPPRWHYRPHFIAPPHLRHHRHHGHGHGHGHGRGPRHHFEYR